jgi:Ran GTPase-activating protein (RanGAP) involved in mRNA processing and transport
VLTRGRALRRIGDHGVAALATSLCTNGALQTLALQGNQVGPGGARQLAQALKSNGALRALDLSENPIGPPGASCVGMALCFNTGLRELRVRGCGAGDTGVGFLCEALRRHAALPHLGRGALRLLDARDNGLSPEAARALADAARGGAGAAPAELLVDCSPPLSPPAAGAGAAAGAPAALRVAV